MEACRIQIQLQRQLRLLIKIKRIIMSLIFGIIIAALVFFFSNEIQEIMVSSGLRDYLVNWLQSW